MTVIFSEGQIFSKPNVLCLNVASEQQEQFKPSDWPVHPTTQTDK